MSDETVPLNCSRTLEEKPGAGAGAADGIRKFVARGGNAEKKVIHPKWNIYVTVLKKFYNEELIK